MKPFLLIATYFVGFGELLLALYFLWTHSSSGVRKLMACTSFFTGMWALTSVIIAYQAYSSGYLIVAEKAVFIFGAILVTSLLHFAIIFPYPLIRFDYFHAVLLYIPAAFLSIIAATTNLISRGSIGSTNFAGEVIQGPLYPHYNVYLLLLYGATIVILATKLGRTEGIHKRNTRLMFTAITLGGLPAVFVDLIAPLLGLSMNFLSGVLFTGIWLGVISFIVFRKN